VDSYATLGAWLRAMVMDGLNVLAAVNTGENLALLDPFNYLEMAQSCYSTAHRGYTMVIPGEFQVERVDSHETIIEGAIRAKLVEETGINPSRSRKRYTPLPMITTSGVIRL
jgi:hypothetical protein